jgi:hypothetical protein
MKDVLGEGDYKEFKAALDRPPGFAAVDLPPAGFGAKGKGKGKGDVERRLDLLQREVDDLRRKLDKK